ncbi:MAG: hypothetical protein JSV88_03135 [Candidatus Aminicenantes bacterium]|nr:MAG: hypothetical protein JSV88_03135 [Candidatus Aminicenantes bacterium]
MDIILAIIGGVLIFLVIQLRIHFDLAFLRWLHKVEHQLGSKLMVAFLGSFIVFILLTDKVPQPGQKIPIIIAALLLIWANLFLKVGRSEESDGDKEEKEKK